jgi:membrane-associated phospholipid phosphatase
MDELRKKKVIEQITDACNPFITVLPLSHLIFLFTSEPKNYLAFFTSLFLQVISPALLLLFMMRQHMISDRELSDRQERRVYFLIVSLFFGASFLFCGTTEYALYNFVLLVAVFIAWLVGLYWKISGHMLFDTALFLLLGWIYTPFYLLQFLLPLIAYTRVYLQKHTIPQTIAGSIAGLFAFILGLSLY